MNLRSASRRAGTLGAPIGYSAEAVEKARLQRVRAEHERLDQERAERNAAADAAAARVAAEAERRAANVPKIAAVRDLLRALHARRAPLEDAFAAEVAPIDEEIAELLGQLEELR